MDKKAPQPPLSKFQQVQKVAHDVVEDASSKVGEQISSALTGIDRKLDISGNLRSAGTTTAEIAHALDDRFNLSGKAQTISVEVRSKIQDARGQVASAADEIGISTAIDKLRDGARTARHALSSNAAIQTAAQGVEWTYGKVRRAAVELLDPYLPTYDLEELMRAAQRELTRTAACILQIGLGESSALARQFRSVAIVKSGLASSSAILGLVASYGTASTGTAISTLSGAAATSASLAWVGGMVGGGVAAGTVITGGVGVLAAAAAHKFLKSEARPIESLNDLEKWVVQSALALSQACAENRRAPFRIDVVELSRLLKDGLDPLYARIQDNIDELCAPLDVTNAISLRQHALPALKSGVRDRLSAYIEWLESAEGQLWLAELPKYAPNDTQEGGPRVGPSGAAQTPAPTEGSGSHDDDQRAMYVIGGVFAALISREPLDGSIESMLVVDALRRAVPALADASEAEMTDYMGGLDEQQCRGLAAAVKGIYHELYYVIEYNEEHVDTYAELAASSTQAGWDVIIRDSQTGEAIEVLQLKAVTSVGSILRHLREHPAIHVVATSEVAASLDDPRVTNSGFENRALSQEVANNLDGLHDHAISDRATDVFFASFEVSGVHAVIQMMRGEIEFPEAVTAAAGRAGISAGTALMTMLLFG